MDKFSEKGIELDRLRLCLAANRLKITCLSWFLPARADCIYIGVLRTRFLICTTNLCKFATAAVKGTTAVAFNI